MKRRGLALVIAVPLCALVPANAVAATGPHFLAPQTLAGPAPNTSGQSANDPAVGMDAAGDAVEAFSLYDSTVGKWKLEVATRPAGGAFGQPQILSTDNNPADAQLAVGRNGDAAIAWLDGGVPTVVFRAAGAASFGARQALAQQFGESLGVGVDGGGNVVVAWIQVSPQNSGSNCVEASIRSKASGDWSLPAKISGPADGVVPNYVNVAMAPSGDALVTWRQGADYRMQAPYSARAAFRPAGQHFDPSTTLGASDSDEVFAAMGADGRAVAAWTGSSQALAAVRPPNGAFGAPAMAGNGAALGVAAGGDGSTDVLLETSANELAVALGSASGAFSAQPTVLTTDGPTDASIAAGADGTALVSWFAAHISSPVHRIVGAATRLPGGGFATQPSIVDTTASGDFVDDPAAAVDGAGDGLVTWRRTTSNQDTIALAPFDGAGPQLRGLSAPSALAAGAPGAFAFSPVDVWSPVASAGWSFGDALSSDSATTTHAYAAAGSYTAIAQASDTLGNASRATLPLTVGPPTSGAPGAGGAVPLAAAPKLTSVSLTHTRFRVGRHSTALVARHVPIGTTFRYTLSKAATVTIAITRTRTGHRSGRRCLAKGKGRRCTRHVPVGKLTRRARAAGRRRVAFSGRLGRHALSPGSYIATFVAVDASHRRSHSVKRTFHVVR